MWSSQGSAVTAVEDMLRLFKISQRTLVLANTAVSQKLKRTDTDGDLNR